MTLFVTLCTALSTLLILVFAIFFVPRTVASILGSYQLFVWFSNNADKFVDNTSLGLDICLCIVVIFGISLDADMFKANKIAP